MDDLRHVLRLTHTLWGGSHNPVIPVGRNGSADELVKLYRVDALYPAVEEESLRGFLDRFPYLRWPFVHRSLFINGAAGQGLSTLLDIYHPVRKVFDEFVKPEREIKSRATIFNWSDADPLADIFLASFGSYPAKAEVGFDSEDFVFRNLHAKKVMLGIDTALPADAYKAFTISAVAGYELHPDRLPSWDYPGLYVGNSQNFEDVVNFWNLRAADLDLLFFDPLHEDRLKEMGEAYIEALGAHVKDPLEADGRIALWYRDGNEIDVKKFQKANMHVRVGDGLWNGLNLKPPLMYIDDKAMLGAESDYGDVPSVSFELREKPFFDDVDARQQHLVVTVRLFTYGESAETTFKLPFLPELNDFYRPNVTSVYPVRSEHDGLGVILRVTANDLRMRAVSARPW